jgi:ATP-dependent RNA helicase DDX1
MERDKGSFPKDDKNQNEKGKKQSTKEVSPKFSMSVQDRDPTIAFHPDGKNLRLQSQDKTRWAGCRCTSGIFVNSLKDGDQAMGFSFECTILDKDGTVRIGWSSSEDASLQLGTDREGFGYGGTGVKVNGGNYTPFPSKENKVQFTMGDVVGCHLKVFPPRKDEKGNNDKERKDIVSSQISFSKNGELVGKAFDLVRSGNNKLSLYPTVCIKNAECELNFGGDESRPLRFPLPEGYQPLSAVVGETAAVNPRDALSFRLEQQNSSERKGPLAIIIEPTRDLAEQR